jgi:hypothetical protein
MSELRVSADLMNRGYHVFRALAPACPVDLMILNGTNAYKVEVKTGNYKPDGGIYWPAADSTKFDVLAVALHDRIIYRPELPTIEGTAGNGPPL